MFNPFRQFRIKYRSIRYCRHYNMYIFHYQAPIYCSIFRGHQTPTRGAFIGREPALTPSRRSASRESYRRHLWRIISAASKLTVCVCVCCSGHKLSMAYTRVQILIIRTYGVVTINIISRTEYTTFERFNDRKIGISYLSIG